MVSLVSVLFIVAFGSRAGFAADSLPPLDERQVPHSVLELDAAFDPDKEPSRDWPRWRGPKADGVADTRKLPTRWSPSENIRWSVKLPGWGTSSPVVYGSRVFVTSELNQEDK